VETESTYSQEQNPILQFRVQFRSDLFRTAKSFNSEGSNELCEEREREKEQASQKARAITTLSCGKHHHGNSLVLLKLQILLSTPISTR
jgi:hypothetical protein